MLATMGGKENTHRFSVQESQGQKAVRKPTLI